MTKCALSSSSSDCSGKVRKTMVLSSGPFHLWLLETQFGGGWVKAPDKHHSAPVLRHLLGTWNWATWTLSPHHWLFFITVKESRPALAMGGHLRSSCTRSHTRIFKARGLERDFLRVLNIFTLSARKGLHQAVVLAGEGPLPASFTTLIELFHRDCVPHSGRMVLEQEVKK